MRKKHFFKLVTVALSVLGFLPLTLMSQSVSEVEKQKAVADKEIKETKAELSANEKKVNAELSTLRKLDGEIAVSQKEIETVSGQLAVINGKIEKLESNIKAEENELKALREEYLKAVKKMRSARKGSSGMAFLFSSNSFNEARRRMRYMKEFSEWKTRRSDEITDKVKILEQQRTQLAQARNDANVAIQREKAIQSKLSQQRDERQATVSELKANSDVLRSKLAKRQAEAKKLSSQISSLIAEQQAKEAEKKRKAAEEKRLAEERKAAEEKRMAEERKAAEEKRLAAAKKAQEEKTVANKTRKEETQEPKKEIKEELAQAEEKGKNNSQNSEYADARKRKRTQPKDGSSTVSSSKSPEKPVQTTTVKGFEAMRGSLPKPVSGSFKIVSPFGVHPISPELPDIMDENLGIDAHVTNGANAVAVFEGEVIKIYDRTNTPGFRNIVVLKHGDYLTVYANLETLAVKTGQNVKQGQSLGSVGSDFDDPSHGMIHFEVWKNQTHLDPSKWIK